jgi:hypothetical protein
MLCCVRVCLCMRVQCACAPSGALQPPMLSSCSCCHAGAVCPSHPHPRPRPRPRPRPHPRPLLLTCCAQEASRYGACQAHIDGVMLPTQLPQRKLHTARHSTTQHSGSVGGGGGVVVVVVATIVVGGRPRPRLGVSVRVGPKYTHRPDQCTPMPLHCLLLFDIK